MNKINQNIDLNLQIIYNSKNHSVMTSDLENIDGEHMTIFEAKKMADYLQSEGLITRNVERCDLTPFGLDVCEAGGWKQYKQTKLSQEKIKNDFESKLVTLQSKNLELLNEKMEYETTTRTQEEKIKNLTEENLQLQNINLYHKIAYTAIGFIVGALLFWFF